MSLIAKVFIFIGSIASIGFGLWHFFVPNIWNWYAYIDVKATELVVAVRAINAFFSLSLVLIGIVNILFAYGEKANRFAVIVMLAATCILWITRVALQLIYPQGSMNPVLQYGMLVAFISVFLCYLISLIMVITTKITT